jgi:hypothetical protein
MTPSAAQRYLKRADLKGRLIDFICAVVISGAVGFVIGKALFT